MNNKKCCLPIIHKTTLLPRVAQHKLSQSLAARKNTRPYCTRNFVIPSSSLATAHHHYLGISSEPQFLPHMIAFNSLQSLMKSVLKLRNIVMKAVPNSLWTEPWVLLPEQTPIPEGEFLTKGKKCCSHNFKTRGHHWNGSKKDRRRASPAIQGMERLQVSLLLGT